MGVFDRFTTKYAFADGATISILHRYALRYKHGARFLDIGFEQALEPGVDRLVHEETIRTWTMPSGEMSVSPAEKAQITARIEEYCRAKGFTYRIVGGASV